MNHRRPCPPDCIHCEQRGEDLRDRLHDATREERAYEADQLADQYERHLDQLGPAT